MNITGKSVIAGEWQSDVEATSFESLWVEDNVGSSQHFANATDDEINAAAQAAEAAFWEYCETTREQRAAFIDTIAENILGLGEQLISITHKETGLPEARLQGERMRTVNQLKLFANKLRNESAHIIDDEAEPARQPLPKPATQLRYIAIGPVAVFGASNFPYAFSVLGGDTASALAAGCPVVVKGHPAHPATSELMAKAITAAIEQCQMPAGVFSLLQGADPRVSHTLVTQPAIKAVGFTGSYAVARVLQQSIATRVEPIPFYGELGSINPQIVLSNQMKQQAENLAATFVQSLMMGQGQFCTSPGLWLVPADNDVFVAQVAEQIAQQASAPLLTPGILKGYQSALQAVSELEGVSLVGQNQVAKEHYPVASVFKTDVETYQSNPSLSQEVFGPFALIVEYSSGDQLFELVAELEGQLTATLHGDDDDLRGSDALAKRLQHKVGRLIYNQMPTGVEVCASMNHGGPFPSSTDVRSTSVGSQAMERFLRPLCVQNAPQLT